MSNDIARQFRRYVCQTSAAPLGLEIVRAEGVRVWDRAGREYIDLLSGMGVASVGHCNPHVVRAVKEQADRYLHAMVYGEYVQEPQVALARELAHLAPGDLEVTYFTNSGTEAIEGALKLARKTTGRSRYVAFDGAFHGDTFGALSVGGNPTYRKPFEPLLPQVRFLPFGELSGLDAIDRSVAAVIVEPIQVEGGVRIPRDTFLPALRRRCSETGALLIVDEVVTGICRTGRWFACEHYEVVPDVLVLAKALGGGMPLGAFIGRREVMCELSHNPPLAHVTTFGGHPVSCAAGLAAIQFARAKDLAGAATQTGKLWFDYLSTMIGPIVRSVRGKGLLLGIDFASPDLTREFCRGALDAGLILNWTLHRDNVVRLAPPLVIGEADSKEALERIAAVVKRLC